MAYHKSTFGLSHGNNWDTFFVEGEGPGAYPRLGAKARAKELARITQDSLASELAKVTAAEYKQDIVDCLLNMEVSDSEAIYGETLTDPEPVRRLARRQLN